MILPAVYAFLIAAVLVLGTVFVHYEALTLSWPVHRAAPATLRTHMLQLIGGIFVAHLFEILCYAVAFYVMHGHLGLGTITGATTEGAMDYLYFSITSYTTLGFGDVYPTGPIRIVAGIESLNGLVLIGWSTSYTYLAMQRVSRAAHSAQREDEVVK